MEHLLNIEDLCVTYRNKERQVYAVRKASLKLNIGDFSRDCGRVRLRKINIGNGGNSAASVRQCRSDWQM